MTYLPITAIALLEVLVSEQISCERSHGLDISGCDFIQILKLLQTTTTTVRCQINHTCCFSIHTHPDGSNI